ncbi:3-oxoacyl-[acyl-carrier-protein] synthase 2 [Pigmentiphaga humi]|uniref:3-oxoacyl-[acyl-carrier-protein] synthase 2 n=1 Tax=Pigmentiphaga humi TaxID=2478468 RepID=A0A3P4B507_9BURK|nr:beta-ketoacyl-ACP synthase [Pigmentiphaga humi]VCU71377.1 3-oxoacyl-[acyl-carrier-protein] synthase 2 [Pigmentiphaga humi]
MKTWLGPPGLVCALGSGIAEVRARLHAGDTSGMRPRAGWIAGRTPVLGAYEGVLPEWPGHIPAHHRTRNNRLLLAAARQIEPALRNALARHGAHRVAVVLGTSTSGVDDNVDAFRSLAADNAWPAAYDYRRQALSSPSAFLSDWLGATGPAYTLSTACTSSARALITARHLLAMGVCDAVVCGGADSLCRLTINGFAALGAVADTLCRPFSAHRAGINIGEAGVVFLMERDPAAPGSVALLGGGGSSDAWHMSAPDPSGAGAAKAMRAALQDACVEPEAVGWINLHGTATEHNDAMESLAVQAIFPDLDVPCASTKALTGHTLGAAGALEAALAWLTLDPANRDGALPPHVWDAQPDPALPRLSFSTAGHRYPPGCARVAMSNSFAFGGNNTTLILGSAA